jgi:hypothetical protein
MTFAAIVYAPLTVFVAQLDRAQPLARAEAGRLTLAPRGGRGRIGGMRWPAAFLVVLAWMSFSAVQGAAQKAPPDGLEIFKAWLDRVHPGYACDEGPARFRNQTVETAYPGRRFYYVLTHPRGIRLPLPNELSVVAHVDDSGNVTPFSPSSPATYRHGLRKVSTARDARQAGAAVLILAMGDPGEGLRKLQDSLFTVKKERKGWVCIYGRRDARYTSQVTFDRNGVLSTISVNLPPVP